MKFLSSCLLITISTFFTVNSFAAGKVSYLNVDGDNVHFATAEVKAAASPGCAVEASKEHFAVSLRTEAGRAMYSLLITAMSSDVPVTVVSANDCADAFGLERAQSVSISPEVTPVERSNSDAENDTFSNTILDTAIESYDGHFQIKNGLRNHELNYYTYAFHSAQGVKGAVLTGSRTQLANITGHGWLTAILTPITTNVYNSNSTLKLEVIIDGEIKTIELKPQLVGTRFFLGLSKTSIAENINSDIFNWIQNPSYVVNVGKGVRFEQSMEVWITMGEAPPASSPLNYFGVNYVRGSNH